MSAGVQCAPPEWLLLQLADSAFPTGGFAHSGGLEAAWQHGAVRNRADLIQFLEGAIGQCARGALPFAAAAFDGELSFAELDETCDAFTTNHVANRASRAQGRAFLGIAATAFQNGSVHALREQVRNEHLPGHFAVVFGRSLRDLQFGRMETLRLFLFTQLRGWVSSAVRLNIVGPMEGQALQWRLAPCAEQQLLANADLPLERAAQTAPLLEIFQGTQDRLYSRLFQS